MLTVLTANGPSGYSIANSLRFRSSASAYLNRTLTTPANAYKWTWSGWLKRGVFADVPFFSGYNTGALTRTFISFSSDTILFYQASGSGGSITYPVRFFTTPVYRDPSAWYHIILSYDSTQATSTNRVSFYVNGVQVTNFSVADYPSQNYACDINAATTHTICRDGYNNTNGFDGYLTEVNFIDGQALTPSSFGEIDSTTGVWKAKRYTGTYGTNGFKLNFSNGTSTTTLGYDSSGNGNNWTTNNISLTAGSTYDWMLDSPTPFQGSSYGVGNYAVLNPLLLWNTNGSPFTLTNGNLSVSEPGTSTYGSVASTIACPTSGKWYCEITPTAVGAAKFTYVGITSTTSAANVPGFTATSYAYQADGTKVNNGTATAYGAAYVANDVIGIAYDADSAALTFYKNGTSQGTAFTSITAGSYYFVVGDYATTQSSAFDANFGQRPFAYTPPSGYKSLCTQNLPAPSIANGANHMAATLYTGTGSSLSVSNTVNSVSFQPDFVWIKSRSAATDHALYDVIRGTQNRLESNTTDAAVATDAGLTAFNASGFTVNTLAQVNTNAATYIGWQWKAGGTAVTNTAGSITSSVSANPTAGFSVVTYTGTGSNATVGHGLGATPAMIIVKYRGAASDWVVNHISLSSRVNDYLSLNSTSAVQTISGEWYQAPNSTTFGVGPNLSPNGGGCVAYCFAAIPGYSAFGSYTGNGSTDGPFVYCGFRPRFVMVKSSSAVASWFILDTARNTYNAVGNSLYPNLNIAEDTGYYVIDALSNGFKLRSSYVNANNSGATYIYACFAENPFQNALAR